MQYRLAGTTKFCIGENGGRMYHIVQGSFTMFSQTFGIKKSDCDDALKDLQNGMENVIKKPVYPRMTEIVLERTFEIKDGVKLLEDAGHKVSLTDSQYAFHINSHGVNKGSGLREAMRMLAIESKDIIAIGDSVTDVPMFEVAKTSIALGNASEHVRSKATMTVDSKAGDGLLDAMDLLGPKMSGDMP